MQRPGPHNAITDVPGIQVGNAEDRELVTGATVVLADRPVTAACDVRGGGPGVRDTEVLGPSATVQAVDAIALSGGSAFGLDAAGGAMDWLRRQGRGFEVADVRVPIVPGAIIFDLTTGPQRDWEASPWWSLGQQAAAAASKGFALGNAGAGLGATAGPLKGGLGTASLTWDGFMIGAIAVANPIGSVTVPGSRHFWAWAMEHAGEYGGLGPPARMPDTLVPVTKGGAGENTTLVVVATNARLDWAQTARLAVMAQDGLAQAIRPVHGPLDGDTVFALATGDIPLRDPLHDLTRMGMFGADCAARAVTRGVFEAESLGAIPAWRDLPGRR
ncbi:MAG: P1 family peptidase [Pseudomonadota bacterium]